MARPIAANLPEAVQGIKAFNEGLRDGDPRVRERIADLLPYFRAWYYAPQLDAAGPSKFIGYRGMDLSTYVEAGDLDGRVTEPILAKWFDVLESGSPEYARAAARVDELLRSHGKTPNRAARYCAPRGWRLADIDAGEVKESGTPRSMPETSDASLTPMGEVFWKAFLTLYPEDQRALAQRILVSLGRIGK